ncbi:calcium/calmodulin-dependent protein kinase type 1G-like [Homarus americanus]|uniref:calcium/calmodulin-dependent protein kinase type 1G-like n=1 Tax=Homarus americanus TaxID=6706 RepID=UPI001C462443|nr:calcium/calmodulin-dependent protein kinase type 1G-like [Homarus americanus]
MTFSTVYEESFIDRVYDTCEEHRVTIIDTLICESMILKRQPQYLGSGSSGHSFAVQVGHQRWVLKQYYDDPVVQDIMLREIVQLSSVQNFPCVQRLVGVVPEYLTIVTQYAGEPLHTCITKKLYSPNEFISIMQQVLNAVKYLHSKHILHLNLKPAKICILRDKEGDLRFSSRLQVSSAQLVRSLCHSCSTESLATLPTISIALAGCWPRCCHTC